ncbi:uncharacterized protein LOC122057591 [Macadamia integrifolia]|uniref:uncharacterized protein LOC122057591 n=1 Tax=Macadamia integrifolia TaxID=60698 RepID=UPI001C52FBA8|nr:uncharacterized protein LOC122057591 [Macadamia integrifolia]XP_042475676.1 uncharacterized protein LOC122057591 [Macadamia integrifolia]
MATQTQGLSKDHNFNDHFKGPFVGGEHNASGAQKEVKLGNRKALTDLTNSGKLSLHQATKKNNFKNLNASGGSINMSKPLLSVGRTTCVSNVQGEVGLGGRKALTDVTSSGGPSRHQTTKKKHLSSSRINNYDCKSEEKVELGCRKVLSDIGNLRKPSLHQTVKKTYPNKLDAIAEEQCMHDHQKCINSQKRAMDMHFLSMMTPGLDSEFSMEIASPGGVSCPKKSKVESSPRYLELEEIPGLLDECVSPLQCWSWTPKSPKTSTYRTGGYPSPNLMLKGTPELSKY